jgi:hypothetical protein
VTEPFLELIGERFDDFRRLVEQGLSLVKANLDRGLPCVKDCDAMVKQI